MSEFKIRRPVPSDVEFLIKTWLREYRREVPAAMPDRLYYNEFQKVILALTRKSDARVICAVGDANYICGFVVGTSYAAEKTAVVHFAYMRPPFRRLGLVTQALEDMGYEVGHELVASHWHPYLDRFQRKDLIFNPFILYKVE